MYLIDISSPITCTMMGRMKQKNGWERRKPRRIGENLFVFMIDGEALFTVEGKKMPVRVGSILIIPKGTLYTAVTDDSCEYIFFHFSGDITECEAVPPRDLFPSEYSFRLPPCRHDKIAVLRLSDIGSRKGTFFSSALLCEEYHARGTSAARLLMDIEFTKLLVMLSENVTGEPILRSSTLQNLMTHMKMNLASPFRMSELCAECGITPSYAARLFKKNLGMTATEYFYREKLRYATELMENTGLNLTEIADFLGFCDVFHFSRLFKKYIGVSPSEYKKARLGKT